MARSGFTGATLRTKLLLVVLLAAILPLGLVGYWLTRSTLRSGEELLRARLDAGVRGMAREIGSRWTNHRSHLIDFSESPAIQSVLGVQASQSGAGGGAGVPTRIDDEVRALFERYRDDVLEVVVRDTLELPRLRLPDAEGPTVPSVPDLPVSVDIYTPFEGRLLGRIDARLRFSSLLAGTGDWGGTPGSVIAAFDARDGLPLLPLSIDPDLLARPRFQWRDETWVAAHAAVGDPPIELVLAAPATPFEAPFAAATRRGTIALLLVGLSSIVLVTAITSRITASLGRIADAADAVAGGDLEQSVPEEGGRELGRVARAFNRMTGNLRRSLDALARQQALAAVGEFAASLAHEVRNPLSSVRMDLQMAQEQATESANAGLISRALATIDRLSATVTGALRIARSGTVQREPLDLWATLERAAAGAAAEFTRCGAQFVAPRRNGNVYISGDAAALEQAILNLLLNAAHAAGDGGHVGMDVFKGKDSIAIAIHDDGAGLSEEDRARAFEPFFSTKPEGTGLGLPIAHRIVAAHGGELTIGERTGGGTIVTMVLPKRA